MDKKLRISLNTKKYIDLLKYFKYPEGEIGPTWTDITELERYMSNRKAKPSFRKKS